MSLSGALLIHKPEGITSSGVVTQIKWALQNNAYTPKGFKIGHGGTLDPFATGLLIVLLGEATKLADAYLHSQKAYDGIIQLGRETDTGDPTGQVTLEKELQHQSLETWQAQAQTFVNQVYLQTPPMYSAKKKDGVALHVMARAGKIIERPAIQKKIYAFDLCLMEPDLIEFQVQCESGTYIRVLAEDLAKKNNNLAHLKTLRRTRSSDCKLESSISLDEALQSIARKESLLECPAYRPLESLASHLPSVELDPLTTQQLRQGLKSAQETLIHILKHRKLRERYALAKQGQQIVALFERISEESDYRLQRVFNHEMDE